MQSSFTSGGRFPGGPDMHPDLFPNYYLRKQSPHFLQPYPSRLDETSLQNADRPTRAEIPSAGANIPGNGFTAFVPVKYSCLRPTAPSSRLNRASRYGVETPSKQIRSARVFY
jgi:hypothetical protein